MDYRATTPFQTPPVSLTSAGFVATSAELAVADTTLKWDVFRTDSGESGIVIPGENQTIKLDRMKVAWNKVIGPGEIVVTMPDRPAIIILQSDAGSTDFDFHLMPVALEDYGIRTANNSVGGQYSVTIFYYTV